MKVEMDQLGGGLFLNTEIFTQSNVTGSAIAHFTQSNVTGSAIAHFCTYIMLAETFQNTDMHREGYTI